MATGVLATLAHYRVTTYAVVSLGLLLGVILRAVEKHSNFYSIAVDLSRNSRSVLVLANFGVLIALFIGRIFQQVFFGTLRASELERLYDRVWFFLTESLLAWTIFRDELDTGFAIMFGFLLFAKCFHWLLEDRIEWMDQVPHPGPSWAFHIRCNALFFVLWGIDVFMLALALESILSSGMSGIVLFASEYTILLATLLNCMLKYHIVLHDIRRAARLGGDTAPPWEDKSMYIFYVELITDFLKLITYLTFFCLVLTYYGLPLNIVRDVFLTARSFISRLRDLIRYRAATRNMDERYPNATIEEMQAMSDRTCIICREEMVVHPPEGEAGAPLAQGQGANAPAADGTAPAPAPAAPAANGAPAQRAGPNDTPKKLPCGHVFHFHCLRSWLERQQSCPTCRRSVLEDRRRANVPDANAPNGNAPAANGAPAAPQPGQQPDPRMPRLLANELGRLAHARDRINQQRVDVANLHQQIQRLEQALLHQHGNNLVPNQLQYGQGPPPGWAGLPPPPAGPGHGAPNANGMPDLIPLDGAPLPPAPGQGVEQPVQEAPRTPAAPAPANVTEPAGATPAPSAGASETSTSAQPAAASQAAGSPPAPTPTTPTPSAARPAQVPDTANRTAAYEAALRRLGYNQPQAQAQPQAGPSTSVPNLPSQAQQQPMAQSRPSARPGVSYPSNANRRPNISESRARHPAAAAVRTGSPTTPGAPSTPFTFTAPNPGTPRMVGPGAPTLPGAIPLYDPTYAHIPGHPLLSFQQALAPGYGGVPQAHYVRAPVPGLAVNPPAFRGVGMGLGDLPPRLSDEQLARMDTLTRDAIDERLRVLDNVQGTLQRCTEELLRARSVLPPFAAAPPIVHPTPTAAPIPTADPAPPPALTADPTHVAPAAAILPTSAPGQSPLPPPILPVERVIATEVKKQHALAGLYTQLRLTTDPEERARIQEAINALAQPVLEGLAGLREELNILAEDRANLEQAIDELAHERMNGHTEPPVDDHVHEEDGSAPEALPQDKGKGKAPEAAPVVEGYTEDPHAEEGASGSAG